MTRPIVNCTSPIAAWTSTYQVGSLMSSQPAVFAPGPDPQEIADIAANLRRAAGLSREPTGVVAQQAHNGK